MKKAWGVQPVWQWLAIWLMLTNATETLSQTPQATEFDYQTEEVAAGLNFPWSVVFLPDGGLLVSERTGQIKLLGNDVEPISLKGIPDDLYVKGQGGLQDLALHPDFARNGWVYLSYSAGQDDANGLKVVRGKLSGDGFTSWEDVHAVDPLKDTPAHYGARLAFLPDNSLLITSGDGFDFREDAQRLNNQLGKVLRVNDSGGAAAGNPFLDHSDPLAHPVFSLGHRNPQGVLYDPVKRLIFLHEHGPAGGDEINIVQPGSNYGWPVVTNGRDYSGASISPFKDYPGMELPFVDWTPSVAPSGMSVYYGEMFEELNGDLLVSTLKSQEVIWVKLSGPTLEGQGSLFRELGQRIRDVKVHPDGSIYLLTDSEDGKVLRIFRE